MSAIKLRPTSVNVITEGLLFNSEWTAPRKGRVYKHEAKICTLRLFKWVLRSRKSFNADLDLALHN